jgi:serine/threonine protein kinase
MIPAVNQVKRNNVTNRFLPIAESVLKNLENEAKLSDFNLLKELGAGSFGRVLLVQHKITQAKYAIKAIDKRNQANYEERRYFRREIEIMYRVHHPNVVKLFGHFEDNTYCYFIMEYIPGGNIYSLVPKNNIRQINTQQIASIMKDVISAVYFLHHMHPKIVHRDIKPENVLLDQGMVAKLTDFGWSNYMQGDMKRTTVCGTPVYLAPEIINNQGHDEHVDIWCIGVLLFELMAGYSPWQGNDVQTVKYNISRLKIQWPRDMDRDAADLISRILKYNPEERISLSQMLLHPFFTKFFPNAISSLIKPDNSIQYKVFIVSKDNPLTWNPIFNGTDLGLRLKPYSNVQYTTLNQYNYNNLLQKYDNLKREYQELRTAGFSTTALDSLRRELKEKEEKINQLARTANNFKYKNNDLRITYDDLVTENYDLKNRLNVYENHFKSQNGVIYLDKYFNEIRNSISNNNKAGFNQAINRLKTNIDNYTQNNYNAILNMKDREIEKWKEEERLRREREKQQFNALINRYDQTLSMGERENQELKMRLKELESYFV